MLDIKPVCILRCCGFGLLLLVSASVASAMGYGDDVPGLTIETQATQVEGLIENLLSSNLATPEYTDHGGGLYSLSISLSPEQREKLNSLFREGSDSKATAYYFLAAGQSLAPQTNPSALVHAAISNAQLGYNYWVMVLNLGSGISRKTTFKLTGPGRTFNRSAVFLYPANSFAIYWYSAPSVGAPGFYRYAATVAGGGTFTTNSIAGN